MEKEDSLFIMPTIEVILSHKRAREPSNIIEIGEEEEEKDNNDEYIHLAKFHQKSYHRCQWLTEAELS